MIIWNGRGFGPVQKSPSSKATAIFARGAYTEYVSTEKWRERRWRLSSTGPNIQQVGWGNCLMPDIEYSDSEQEQLEAEAVQWIVCLTSGETTADDRRAAESWRRQSRAHQQAFEKALRLWKGMGALPKVLLTPDVPGGFDRQLPQESKKPAPSRRYVGQKAWLSGAMAAAIAALVFTWSIQSNFFAKWKADLSTGTGEQIMWKLGDGSMVQLNTQAALNFQYSPAARRVDLLEGEAAFQVAKDPSRPFIVQTTTGTIRAVGTEFLVNQRNDIVLVTVIEGVVEVSSVPGHGRPQASVYLRAGQQVQMDDASGLNTVEDVDLRMVTAWQRGRLIFEEVPLTDVVEEINRYRPGYIFILNDTLRRHKVNGVFDLHRLHSAVATIERTLPVTSLHLSERLIFLQ